MPMQMQLKSLKLLRNFTYGQLLSPRFPVLRSTSRASVTGVLTRYVPGYKVHGHLPHAGLCNPHEFNLEYSLPHPLYSVHHLPLSISTTRI